MDASQITVAEALTLRDRALALGARATIEVRVHGLTDRDVDALLAQIRAEGGTIAERSREWAHWASIPAERGTDVEVTLFRPDDAAVRDAEIAGVR